MKRSTEVDEYYAKAPEKFQSLLKETRDNVFDILACEPEISEVYSYRIAVYKYGNKPLFSIAYFKDHCSFISQDKYILEKVPELEGYKISGTSIHFTNDKPLSKELLKRIIEVRLKDSR